MNNKTSSKRIHNSYSIKNKSGETVAYISGPSPDKKSNVVMSKSGVGTGANKKSLKSK